MSGTPGTPEAPYLGYTTSLLAADLDSWYPGGGGASLPDQTGNSGKFLTTDGSAASWAGVPASGLLGTTLAANVVTSSLTALGTIATGVWQGTQIADTYLAALSASKLTGTTLPASIVTSSLTAVGTLVNLTVTNPIVGSVTGSSGSTTGNAATATALATARNINGTAFDGTANITVTAAAGTLTGTTLNATVVTSSLTAVGTIATGVWNGTTIAIANGGTGETTAANAINALLPDQAAANGQFLTSDGSVASWATVSASDATKLPLAGGTMTGTITSTIGTITANTPVLTASQTWNASGTTFKGIFLNVTNTASAAASLLAELQAGGLSVFSVSPTGVISAGASNTAISPEIRAWQVSNTNYVSIKSDTTSYGSYGNGGGGFFRSNANFLLFYDYAAGHTVLNTGFSGSSEIHFASQGVPKIKMKANGLLYWNGDTGVDRNAAGVMEINNGTAGTFRDILVRSILIDGAPSTAGAGQIAIGADTRTTIGANGGASALTALPVGYIDINVEGSSYQLPYYNRGA